MTLDDLLDSPPRRDAKVASELAPQLSVAKQYLRNEYYPWVQARCPFFTDHGQGHIDAVLTAESLLLEHLLQRNQPRGTQRRLANISLVEAYILVFATILHDAGMVYGRTGHEQRAKDIIKELQALIRDSQLARIIGDVARAHSGKESLRIPRQLERVTVLNKPFDIRARGLAAVLRFADEISETRSRIANVLLNSIPSENRVYWEYAQAVNSSAPIDRTTLAIDYELEISTAATEFEIPAAKGSRQQVTLIEFIFSRLQKVNSERAYCCGLSDGMLALHRVQASLTLLHGGSRLDDFDHDIFWLSDRGLWIVEGEYPDIQFVGQVSTRLPKFSPVEIRSRLKRLQESTGG